MHVFHFRGLSSILIFLLALIGVAIVFLAIPASFMMILWNALIFEGAKGPEINLYQGLLLWGMVLCLLKIVFKPEIRLEFVKANPAKTDKSKKKPRNEPDPLLSKPSDDTPEAGPRP